MARLNTAMTRMSQPKVRSFRGPFNHVLKMALGVCRSKELKYEIAPRPTRYGQSQAALGRSSDGRLSGRVVTKEIPSRTNPITIAIINFQTTDQPEKRMISLAMM